MVHPVILVWSARVNLVRTKKARDGSSLKGILPVYGSAVVKECCNSQTGNSWKSSLVGLVYPFVFDGPRHWQPSVDRLPLSDMIAVNLDHCRLDADSKHGLHFTALPTAWVAGSGR